MFDTENSVSNRRHQRATKNIIMPKSSMGLKRMNTRLSKNQQRQHNQRWNMLIMARHRAVPSNQRLRKKRSNWKRADCNWKQAGYNSKRAANNWRPLVAQVRRQVPRPPRPNTNTMSIRINRRNLIAAIIGAGLLAGCTSTTAPALPANNPADPQVRGRTKTPTNLLTRDETTLGVEKELSQ